MREPEATKLFIGQVPREWTEKELREVLEEFGDIYSLNLLMDKASGQHKGCAFLTYFDNESAKNAQEELHEKRTLPGARSAMKVQPAESEVSEEYRKLFVGMLSRSLDDSDLREMFSSFGTIEDVKILRSPDGKSKGCGFIKYETRLQAQNAIKSMHNSQTMEGCTKPVVVKLADTEKDKVNKLRVQGAQGGMSNIPGIGSAANALQAVGPAQQTAYIQQLMAMPQIISNPTLASASATPGTIGALVAAMASQQQQLQHQQVQPYSEQPSSQSNTNYNNYGSATSQNSTNYSNYGSGVSTGMSSFQNPLGGASNLSMLQNYSTGAQKLPSVQREGPEGANLFIYQIPSEFSDGDLMQTFMPFGNVVSSKVFLDKSTGVSKGFGFVSFDSASNANAAINAMNGFVINGKKMKVEVKRSKDRSKPY